MDQALPTQFPDLGTLFEQMPAMAAYQAGQQQRIAGQNNQSLQDAFRADQEHQAQMRPISLQQALAGVRNTNATAGMHEEQTRGFGLDNQKKNATMGSSIAATNAENKAKLSEAELAQMEAFGSKSSQIAEQLRRLPPMMRPAAAKRMFGADLQDNPELDKLFSENADKLPDLLKQIGDASFNHSKKAREEALRHKREMDKVNAQTSSAERINTANINAGKFKKGSGKAAITQAQAIDKEGDPIKKYTLLLGAIRTAQEAEDDELAQHYRNMAMDVKPLAEQAMAAKGAGAQVVTQTPGQKPTLAPKGSAGPGFPEPPGPTPTAPKTPAPSGGAPVKVNSLQERDALPSGTLYIDPQGNVRKKK